MKITTKEVRDTVKVLGNIIKEYKLENPNKARDWRTYEQRVAKRLKIAFNELKPLVDDAVNSIKIVRGDSRGSKSLTTLNQKVLILLLKNLLGKSNRNMSFMNILFQWLTDISVSYKTIERLYSDEQVILVLHNMHILILKKKGIEEADCSGDGTGYTLTIKQHYSSYAQKLKDKAKENNKQKSDEKKERKHKESKKLQFIYSFSLMDIKTRMYIAYGTSFKSEQDAFFNAIAMAKDTGLKVKTLRLDKYFSAQEYVELCQKNFGKVTLYLIPKKNATIKGSWEWKRMMDSFAHCTKDYLKEYYQRNQSESGISEDKKRTGWKLGQKRPDRIDTADKLRGVWHNLYWLG
ncbi:MAG: ISNCY family transposase [Candidatus Aenigmatarchaeota archaeon]